MALIGNDVNVQGVQGRMGLEDLYDLTVADTRTYCVLAGLTPADRGRPQPAAGPDLYAENVRNVSLRILAGLDSIGA